MENTIHYILLDMPIDSLDLSRELKQVFRKLDFSNLADLTACRTHELLKLEGFDARMLHQYICFMESKELGHLVHP